MKENMLNFKKFQCSLHNVYRAEFTFTLEGICANPSKYDRTSAGFVSNFACGVLRER